MVTTEESGGTSQGIRVENFGGKKPMAIWSSISLDPPQRATRNAAFPTQTRNARELCEFLQVLMV